MSQPSSSLQSRPAAPLAPGSIPTTLPRLTRRPWLLAMGVALLAALIHIAPFWYAQSQPPAGWHFAGNMTVSPDYMQYRVWMRESQISGPLVRNSFTAEPNAPHIPVFFYFALGQVAAWSGAPPETVFAYAGSLLAIALTLLLFGVVRHFMRDPAPTWWVFLALLFGGGLGAHLKVLSNVGLVRDNFLLHRILVEGLWAWPVFEDYRSHYIFITLFDTHFLLIWTLATAAVFAIFLAVRAPTLPRLLLLLALVALTTLVHLYEGITLAVIATAVALLCWRKGVALRPALLALGAVAIAAAAAILWQLALFRGSGLPLPDWRAVNILVATLFIAYPLAWLIIGWGLPGYWRRAGLPETFLLGWAAGCTLLTLSGPFYPYPDRGTMTMQIPLFLIAGQIFFAHRRRVPLAGALLLVVVLGVTPLWMIQRRLETVAFRTDAPYIYLSDEHQTIVTALTQRASRDDLLLADQPDILWLAPAHPGTHYAGHFFLTPDFDRKRAELDGFFGAPPAAQARFLQTSGARFLFVSAAHDPARFATQPGLTPLAESRVGALFEVTPGAAHAR